MIIFTILGVLTFIGLLLGGGSKPQPIIQVIQVIAPSECDDDCEDE